MSEYGKKVEDETKKYMNNLNSVDKEVSDIQHALEGVQVRGALAAGVKKSFDKSKVAEIKSEEAINVTNNILDESFDSSAINANFEQRLDDEINNLQPDWTQFKDQTNSQLAETGDKMNREVISRKQRKPMITIVDDDANKEIITRWEPILQKKNFKMNIAVVTNAPGRENWYATWEEIEHINKTYGVEVLNHTHSHPRLADIISDDELINEFETSTQILNSRGYSGDIMVYPHGSQNLRVRNVAREFCRAGVNIEPIQGTDLINKPPIDTFNLPRKSLMKHGTPMPDIKVFTDEIDNAIAENGAIIFMSHSQYDSFDTEKIEAIIDYANARDIEWVTMSEMLGRVGNIVDGGEGIPGYKPAVIDADGRIHDPDRTHIISRSSTDAYFDKPLTDYEINKEVTEVVLQANASLFPEGKGGVLKTFRWQSDSFNYQYYKIYNTNKVYLRTWVNGAWNEFEDFATSAELNRKVKTHALNHEFPDVPANNIATNKISIDGVSPNDNVFVSFTYGVANRIIPFAHVSAPNEVTVRLANMSNEVISIGNRPIKITVSKV